MRKDKFRFQTPALTFDDVLLVPANSSIVPADTSIKTRLTQKIGLNIPFISAAMDTVTEANMAIALAQLGGLGVIHKNNKFEEQAEMVKAVKKAPKINDETWNSAINDNGELLSAAAIGVGYPAIERAKMLVDVGVDVIFVDTAHGHSNFVLKTVRDLRNMFPDLQIVAGNIVTPEAGEDLINAGADALKIGVGPGSICTTRIIAGVGMPQLTAILEVAQMANEKNIPIIADGGIKFSGDVAKAISAGASTTMIGSLLAGTDEAPGEIIDNMGTKLKAYRGMGSLSAMEKGSSDRYFQKNTTPNKMVPEGVEAYTEYKGSVVDVIFQLAGGLRSAMGYTGNQTIELMRANTQFCQITSAGLKESHVHDVSCITKPANYKQ